MKYQITYRKNDGTLRRTQNSLENANMAVALALSNELADEDLIRIHDEGGKVVFWSEKRRETDMRITTDLVKDAVRVTRDIYISNAAKLAGKNSIIPEVRRAAIMDQLLQDDNLCEMLAGRLHQLSAGTT